MFESSEREESGAEEAAREDPSHAGGGVGGQSGDHDSGAPDLGDEGEHGQTSVPAPEEDAERDES